MATTNADPEADQPSWFREAIAAPCVSSFTDVGGCRIHSLRWTERRRTHDAAGTSPQGVVFVHGTGAHAHWFTHIAPLVADGGYEVLALSLSGLSVSFLLRFADSIVKTYATALSAPFAALTARVVIDFRKRRLNSFSPDHATEDILHLLCGVGW